MDIAACIASHKRQAKVRAPHQRRYWRLGLKSANLPATAIALEDNDESVI